MKVYLAGKIGLGDWRCELVESYGIAIHFCPGKYYEHDLPQWPCLSGAVVDGHDYVGPFFVAGSTQGKHGYREDCESCGNEHGMGCQYSSHGDDQHGVGANQLLDCDRSQVSSACLKAIESADLVFAWIESADCYGTIAELGYARARGKVVAIAGPKLFRDLWFVYTLADPIFRCEEFFHHSISVKAALRMVLKGAEVARLRAMPYKQYLATDHWKKTRAAALHRAENRCQVCNSAADIDVHHRTYERLGCEEPADLTVLCSRCHGVFHEAVPMSSREGHGPALLQFQTNGVKVPAWDN